MLADDELANSLREKIEPAFLSCADPREVLNLVRARHVRVAVISPLDASGRPQVDLVDELRTVSREVRIVVYGKLTCESGRALLDLGRAGADDVVFYGVDDLDTGWTRRLREPSPRGITDRIVACVSGRLNARLEPTLRYCLDHAAEAVNAARVSSAIGVAERTLRGWANQAGFAGIRDIIMACKTAVAVAFVLETDDAAESVALALRFGSASHLRNTVKRRTGATLGEIREDPRLAHWCGVIFRI